mmetsp:Transcript_1687/g.1789  ORF Transcript_1687/g.1789 Transcript_1687/m.1789 type:complete len:326 (-) Transcript_1687:227-1204(-)
MGGLFSGDPVLIARDKLVTTSAGQVDDEDIEELMMVTGYTEKELLDLYGRFRDLDYHQRGKITNEEFLELSEFKLNPFKSRLPYLLQLKSRSEFLPNQEGHAVLSSFWNFGETSTADLDKTENKNKRRSVEFFKVLESRKEDEDDDESYEDSKIEESKTEQKQSDVSQNQTDKSNSKKNNSRLYNSLLGGNLFGLKRKFGKLLKNKNAIEVSPEDDPTAYITFKDFVKFLKIFNPRAPYEDKVKFQFRLFDIDEDKKITEEDLTQVLRMLVEKEENLSHKELKIIVDRVMSETDRSNKGYIDQEDFSRVLASTDFGIKLSIYFAT